MGWIATFNAALQQLNTLGSFQAFGFSFNSPVLMEPGTPVFNFVDADDGSRHVTPIDPVAFTALQPEVHFMGIMTDHLHRPIFGDTKEKDILEYGRFAFGGYLDYLHSETPGAVAYAMHDGSGIVTASGPARDAVGVFCADNTLLIWPRL